MSWKKFLLLFIVFLFSEILILFVLGGIGPDASKENESWIKAGPVTISKYGMGLENFDIVEKWNLDGTPEGQNTFWAINKTTTIMMFLIDLLIIGLAWGGTKALKQVPNKLQGIFEIIIELFQFLCEQTLGEHGKRHMPLIASLFIFLVISNIIVVIPFTEEPTRDLNVTMGQMLVVLFIVHYEAIRIKGIKKYIHEYFEPFIIMFPLNVVGEIAKGVSLSFRLFGNILGGSIIIMVISYLIKYTMVPVALMLFFDLGVGIVQAFVFTMLGMTYLAVAIAE